MVRENNAAANQAADGAAGFDLPPLGPDVDDDTGTRVKSQSIFSPPFCSPLSSFGVGKRAVCAYECPLTPFFTGRGQLLQAQHPIETRLTCLSRTPFRMLMSRSGLRPPAVVVIWRQRQRPVGPGLDKSLDHAATPRASRPEQRPEVRQAGSAAGREPLAE
jgi:hypothetical protein